MGVAQVETEFSWMPRSGICSSTRDIVGDAHAPIRCAVVGVIDEIEMHGQVVDPDAG